MANFLDTTVDDLIGNFEFLGETAAPIAQAAAVFAVLWYVCYWLYQRRAFIRV